MESIEIFHRESGSSETWLAVRSDGMPEVRSELEDYLAAIEEGPRDLI